jgi:hypothetical protein
MAEMLDALYPNSAYADIGNLRQLIEERDAAERSARDMHIVADNAVRERDAAIDAEKIALHEIGIENERLRIIETAAKNLDQHQNEGWATLVSYLIRLHEALYPEEARRVEPTHFQTSVGGEFHPLSDLPGPPTGYSGPRI